MYVQNTNPETHPTLRLRDPEGTLGYDVYFTETGDGRWITAGAFDPEDPDDEVPEDLERVRQVPEDIGEALVAFADHFEEYQAGGD